MICRMTTKETHADWDIVSVYSNANNMRFNLKTPCREYDLSISVTILCQNTEWSYEAVSELWHIFDSGTEEDLVVWRLRNGG